MSLFTDFGREKKKKVGRRWARWPHDDGINPNRGPGVESPWAQTFISPRSFAQLHRALCVHREKYGPLIVVTASIVLVVIRRGFKCQKTTRTVERRKWKRNKFRRTRFHSDLAIMHCGLTFATSRDTKKKPNAYARVDRDKNKTWLWLYFAIL